MKTLFTSCLLLLTLGPGLAAPAEQHAGQPLVHYLTAALHLCPRDARLVQRAVLHNPLALHTPEQVAERLRPVLTAEQFEQYAELENDVTSYQILQRLAAQR